MHSDAEPSGLRPPCTRQGEISFAFLRFNIGHDTWVRRGTGGTRSCIIDHANAMDAEMTVETVLGRGCHPASPSYLPVYKQLGSKLLFEMVLLRGPCREISDVGQQRIAAWWGIWANKTRKLLWMAAPPWTRYSRRTRPKQHGSSLARNLQASPPPPSTDSATVSSTPPAIAGPQQHFRLRDMPSECSSCCYSVARFDVVLGY